MYPKNTAGTQDLSAVVMACVSDLADVLLKIELEHAILEKEILNDDSFEHLHPLLREATMLAQKVLLLSIESGGRDYEAENALLHEAGYYTCTMELAGSRWAMGGIETAKGLILYA